jgi:hypothetical protein
MAKSGDVEVGKLGLDLLSLDPGLDLDASLRASLDAVISNSANKFSDACRKAHPTKLLDMLTKEQRNAEKKKVKMQDSIAFLHRDLSLSWPGSTDPVDRCCCVEQCLAQLEDLNERVSSLACRVIAKHPSSHVVFYLGITAIANHATKPGTKDGPPTSDFTTWGTCYRQRWQNSHFYAFRHGQVFVAALDNDCVPGQLRGFVSGPQWATILEAKWHETNTHLDVDSRTDKGAGAGSAGIGAIYLAWRVLSETEHKNRQQASATAEEESKKAAAEAGRRKAAAAKKRKEALEKFEENARKKACRAAILEWFNRSGFDPEHRSPTYRKLTVDQKKEVRAAVVSGFGESIPATGWEKDIEKWYSRVRTSFRKSPASPGSP